MEKLELNCDCDADAQFTKFDQDGDDRLDIDEFRSLCCSLFQNSEGNVYQLDDSKMIEMFNIFRTSEKYIDRQKLTENWYHWIRTVLYPKAALLIVDVQNDFITGTLSISNCPAHQNGAEVIEPINNLLETVGFDGVYYSLDWHPENHVSFIDNVKNREVHSSSQVSAQEANVYDTVVFSGPPIMEQKLWPKHCVQRTWGAELHKDLKIVTDAVKIYKGTNPDVDSYSAFWDNNKINQTTLDVELKEKNVTDVYVCGIAYDICVAATAVDALALGYRTIVLDDCSRGVDTADIEKTKKIVKESNGVVVNFSQVEAMVRGNDRRPELGYNLALKFKVSGIDKCQ